MLTGKGIQQYVSFEKNLSDSAMDRATFNNIRTQLVTLRQKDCSDASRPQSVTFLEDIISSTEDARDRFDLVELLYAELTRYGLRLEALQVLSRRAEENRNDPLCWISLAEHHALTCDYVAAKVAGFEAVESAKRAGRFLRHAYATLARVARKSEDYELLEDAIRSIVKLRTYPTRADVSLEDDFLNELPEGAIDAELLAAYRRLQQS